MNNELNFLARTFSALDYEFEILDGSGHSFYKSKLYQDIKDNGIVIENNTVKLEDKYFEYKRKSIALEKNIYYINMYIDITKYQLNIMRLKEDALTKLPNRYAIEMFVSNNISNNMIAVICDLDDFKNINDTFGHPQGDIVLSEFGLILKRMMSQNVFVGRYGGEEFVMFFKNVNLKYVKDCLAEIRRQMELSKGLSNDKYNIKMSAGISVMDEDNNLKLAIKEADIALYYVKNNGKNANAIYDKNTNNCYIIE